MSWSSACPLVARCGLRWLPSQNCQASCPYVTQERRRGLRLVQATSIAAPSQAPDGSSTGWSLPLDNAATNHRAPVRVRNKRPTAVAGVTELLTDDAVPLIIKAGSSDDAITGNSGHPQNPGLSLTSGRNEVQTQQRTVIKAVARPPTTSQPGQAPGGQTEQQSESRNAPCASRDPDGNIDVPCTGRTIEPGSTPSTSASSSNNNSNSRCTTTREWGRAGEQFSRRGRRFSTRRDASGSDECSSSNSSGGTRVSETKADSSSKRNQSVECRSAGKRIGNPGIGTCGTSAPHTAERDQGTRHLSTGGRSSVLAAPDPTPNAASGDGCQHRRPLTESSAHTTPSLSTTSAIHSPAKKRSLLTLKQIRSASEPLRPLSPALLRHRLTALTGLTSLDEQACLRAVSAVPGLLLAEPAKLATAWSQLARVLGGVDAARAAWQDAALLLALPPERPARCLAQLGTSLGLAPWQARELLRRAPQIATLAPATLTAKLEGLHRLLLSGASSITEPSGASVTASPTTTEGSSTGGVTGSDNGSCPSPTLSSSSSPSSSAAPTQLYTPQQRPLPGGRRLLASAILRTPRLLTFATATLEQHRTSLVTLLGPTRAAAVLAADPSILTLGSAAVTSKFRLLQTLLDCLAHPQAVALLLGRSPGILRRSTAALTRCCRALSIWRLPPRAKLRMVISRPGLLSLPWQEVHGRCRWLRRLVLSNGYYHSALRRLPPSVLGAVVAALPCAWSRLQYLTESCQEGALTLMAVVECKPAEFEARFPEYERWHAWKVKQMGCDSPWRDAIRIRGFNSAATAKDKPGQVPSYRNNPAQQQQRRLVLMRQRGMSVHHSRPAAVVPTTSVVVTEAGQVRSGRTTVSRPRRVVQRQLMTESGTAVLPAAAQPDGSQPMLSPPTLQRLHVPSTCPGALLPPSALCCIQDNALHPAEMAHHQLSHHMVITQPLQQQQQQQQQELGALRVEQSLRTTGSAEELLGNGSMVSAPEPVALSHAGRPTAAVWVAAVGAPAAATGLEDSQQLLSGRAAG